MITRLPEILEKRIEKMSDEELEIRGWTREGMRNNYLQRLADDVKSPQVGDKAPDFRLERLDDEGQRIGSYMKLSSLRGKPAGLIFGSYT